MAKALQIDPREFGKVMLRYYNPWAARMLFDSDPELARELAAIPARYSEGSKRRRAA
jgi:hypothetical protein